MLVLVARRVGGAPLDREVIVHLARANRSLCLRNQFGPPHLTIPRCSRVNGDLHTLFRASVGRVLEIGRKVDIFRDIAASVDVVLV